MRSIVFAENNIDAEILIECLTYNWSTKDKIFESNTYENRIVNFSGIKLSQCRPENNQIPPNTVRFDLVDISRDHEPTIFIGEDLTIKVLIDGVEEIAFGFKVKSCSFGYGKHSFECEDFLQQYISESEFPNTDLINGLDTSSAEHAGNEKACVPIIFGTPYIPLRTIWDSDERYYILGADSGAYAITKSSYPVDWNRVAEYAAPDYTFPQSTLGGLRVFQVHEDGSYIGSFQQNQKLHDMPTQYNNSSTVSMTNPSNIISYILQLIGVPYAKINATAFSNAAESYTTAGITFNYGYFERRPVIDILSELLISCDSFLRITDTVSLVPRSQSSLKTLSRDDISDYSFSPVVLRKTYDAAYVKYYPNVQVGVNDEKDHTLDVPLDGTTYDEISSGSITIPFFTDTVLLQQLCRVHFRRNFWKVGDISFKAGFPLLNVEPGDVIAIADDELYQGGTVVVDSVSIDREFKLSFTGNVYAGSIGEFSDYNPDERVIDSDTTIVITPDVEGKYKNYIYIRSETQPATPTEVSPAGWTNHPPAGTDTLWVSTAFFIGDVFAEDDTWSTPSIISGDQGETGEKGAGLTYRGDYSGAIQYYYTTVRQDVVRNATTFYACLQTNTGQPVADPEYWDPLPDFESIATDILLVNDANILRSLNVGWEDSVGHLSNCSIMSGMTDPDTGAGFWMGRTGGIPVSSFKGIGGHGLKITGDGDAEFTGNLTVSSGSSGIGNFSDASLANVDSAANTKLVGISPGADVTSLTTMTNALNGQSMITTGAIADSLTSPNLRIDFDDAKITVGDPDGLVIESAGGLTLEYGGKIKFGTLLEFGTFGGDSGWLYLNPTANYGGRLFFGEDLKRFSAISMRASDYIELHCKNSSNDTGSLSVGEVSSGISYSGGSWGVRGSLHLSATGALLRGSYLDTNIAIDDDIAMVSRDNVTIDADGDVVIDADGDVVIDADANTTIGAGNDTVISADNSFLCAAGNRSVLLVASTLLEIHKNKRVMADTTAYDSLIPNTGDVYYYCRTDGMPWARYRNSDGSCYSHASLYF